MRRIVLSMAVMGVPLSVTAHHADAKTFACPQPDGSTLYTDRQAAGCQIIDLQPINPSRTPIKPEPNSGEIKLVPESSARRNTDFRKNYFDTAVRVVPALAFTGGYGPGYIPQAGEVGSHKMTIRHLASGAGPNTKSEAVLDHYAEESLHVAANVAARAVGYDPAYLEVEMRPMQWLVLRNSYGTPMPVTGNSASGIWTIAIAAALLGDDLKPDVCMTGAITADASISFVGKVDQKLFGCISGQYREMLVPAGQSDINVVSNVIGRGVTITEVTDLAQAYEIVTGRPLRQFTPPK